MPVIVFSPASSAQSLVAVVLIPEKSIFSAWFYQIVSYLLNESVTGVEDSVRDPEWPSLVLLTSSL